jgi:histidyl-tRNA synthetase
MRLARGTRLLQGDEARDRRRILNGLIDLAQQAGFEEVVLPSVEPADVYVDKAGPEILSQMYTLADRKGRELCLRPEGTATLQELARSWNGRRRDVRVFYETRCWRYETPQAGRYREFWQFGVEVLNPRRDVRDEVVELGERMVSQFASCERRDNVQRGLAYYTEDGFEVLCPTLGAQKQVLGGGRYAEGIGFAIGLDRLVLAAQSASTT